MGLSLAALIQMYPWRLTIPVLLRSEDSLLAATRDSSSLIPCAGRRKTCGQQRRGRARARRRSGCSWMWARTTARPRSWTGRASAPCSRTARPCCARARPWQSAPSSLHSASSLTPLTWSGFLKLAYFSECFRKAAAKACATVIASTADLRFWRCSAVPKGVGAFRDHCMLPKLHAVILASRAHSPLIVNPRCRRLRTLESHC